MLDNYLSDRYHIFMKQWYMYDEYDIVHPNLVKYSKKCRSTQTSDINVSFILLSDPEGDVHLTKMSL